MRDKKLTIFTLGGTVFMVWMVISTTITSNCGLSLVLLALIAGVVQFFHIPPVHHSRFGENIMSLLTVEKGNRKKNTIFHKAGAAHAPENTMEAVKEAIRLGIPAVEIDLSFTKDGHGVVMHGPKVDDHTDGTGFVHDKTLEELRTLNAAAKFPHKEKYSTARIPTLEECVEECIKNEVVIFFDCKTDPEKTASLLLALYQKYPVLYRLGIVCSFYPLIIYALRQKDSNIITGLTHRNYILEQLGDGSPRNKELWKRLVSPFLDRLLIWAHGYLFWYICGNSFTLLDRGAISGDSKRYWDKLGVHVVAWTVNDQGEKNHLVDNLGVPVITDGLID